MLFQLDVAGGEPSDVYPHFWREHEAEADVRSFAEELVAGVIRARAQLDAVIASAAEHWRIERMAVVDRNILRMAVFEMAQSSTPPVVVLDEAIEVGKKYGSEQSGAFLNGILDAIRKRIERGEIGGLRT
jgi:N utilization substance protein B